jgi:hypothetical protein
VKILSASGATADGESDERQGNMSTLIKKSREWLEVECLRHAKNVPGCGSLERVTIKEADSGLMPNWYGEKFTPPLRSDIETVARRALIKLTAEYLLAEET